MGRDDALSAASMPAGRAVLQSNGGLTTGWPGTRRPFTVYDKQVVSNKNWGGKFFSSSSLAVTVSGAKTHEADFRGDEKPAHVHNVILHCICQ
jgi:hypothetical protein